MAAERQSDKMTCIWSKGVSLNSSMWKKLHPLTFINACWMFIETKHWIWAQWGGGWCVSAVVTLGHLCWYKLLWAWHAGSYSSLVKMHSLWWWQCQKIVFCSWEFALTNSVVIFLVVVSMETNRRYYFQSHLCKNLISPTEWVALDLSERPFHFFLF